jgi:hypothetical protein
MKTGIRGQCTSLMTSGLLGQCVSNEDIIVQSVHNETGCIGRCASIMKKGLRVNVHQMNTRRSVFTA